MGIAIPRPAMRRREERNLHAVLRAHDALQRAMRQDGTPGEIASHDALRIIQTRKLRKSIWKQY